MKKATAAPILVWGVLAGLLALAPTAGPRPAQATIPAPVVLPTKPAPPVDFHSDEIAKFISGLPCSTDSLRALQETPEWKAYAAALDKGWAEIEAKRLQPIREWAGAELAEPNRVTRTLFYPFGGPDFLTAYNLFPQASTYVLFGLEFVGKLPDFDATRPKEGKHVENYLGNLSTALSDFINKSYFITRNMNAALARDKVAGVLPVICLFLKRTNHTISAIKRCEFLAPGEVFEYDFAYPRKTFRKPYGVKIEYFQNGSDTVRSLYYFSCDIADESFPKDGLYYRFLEGLNFETTYIKSASYLMHYKLFANIRGLILAKSRFVLEDDTGIPFKYFGPKVWDARLYGEYTAPVSDFKGVEQADLKAAYTNGAAVRKLPFHLGYHWGSNKDSILYFSRKNGEIPR